jgi:hypothetical protein
MRDLSRHKSEKAWRVPQPSSPCRRYCVLVLSHARKRDHIRGRFVDPLLLVVVMLEGDIYKRALYRDTACHGTCDRDLVLRCSPPHSLHAFAARNPLSIIMAEIKFTTLGWAYIAFASAWTIVLIGAMLFLHRHRQLPFLQNRKLPLLFTAIVLLHIYAASCFVGFTIGPVIPCDAQFWVMSIYLPFGMALLQAANTQFLHVAGQQKKFANFGRLEDNALSGKSAPVDPNLSWWKKILFRIEKADRTSRIVIYIMLAMVVEVRSCRNDIEALLLTVHSWP